MRFIHDIRIACTFYIALNMETIAMNFFFIDISFKLSLFFFFSRRARYWQSFSIFARFKWLRWLFGRWQVKTSSLNFNRFIWKNLENICIASVWIFVDLFRFKFHTTIAKIEAKYILNILRSIEQNGKLDVLQHSFAILTLMFRFFLRGLISSDVFFFSCGFFF